MPNIKSAEKRVLIAKARNARNKSAKSELKTNLKKFDTAVTEGNRETAESAYKVAVKTVDQAASKGLLHKNNAAHKKSGLTVKLNGMAQ
jgi:small subunit ribosomal protein S20